MVELDFTIPLGKCKLVLYSSVDAERREIFSMRNIFFWNVQKYMEVVSISFSNELCGSKIEVWSELLDLVHSVDL